RHYLVELASCVERALDVEDLLAGGLLHEAGDGFLVLHELLLVNVGGHRVGVLMDPVGVMWCVAATAADPHRDALPAAQVSAPDRGEPGPATHVDEDVALHHAVVHLD